VLGKFEIHGNACVFDGMSPSVHAFIRGGLDEADHWCSPGAKGLETLLQ